MPAVTTDTVPYPPGPDPELLSPRLTALPSHVLVYEILLLAWQLIGLALRLALPGLLLFAAIYSARQYAIVVGDENRPYFMQMALSMALLGLFATRIWIAKQVSLDQPTLEATAAEQPALFAFLRRVCDDAGADFPSRVFFIPNVAACVVCHGSLRNVIRSPRYDLYVGLGLVNSLNLSQFQAVLAHEFGHFATRCAAANWVFGLSALASRIQVRLPPRRLFETLPASLMRRFRHEREYHADRVAASVAGSDVALSALGQIPLGKDAYLRAIEDLQAVAEQRIYTSDIYYHLHAAAANLSRTAKDIESYSEAGELHPCLRDRRANLGACNLPAEADARTPWLLFADAASLRRRMTESVLRTWSMIPAGVKLSDPRTVQKLIDDERFSFCFEDKYLGAYDDRDLQLTTDHLQELCDRIRTDAWSDDRLQSVLADLGKDLEPRVAKRNRLLAQRQRFLDFGDVSAGRAAVERLADFDERLRQLDAWFHNFDRRVAFVHLRMASQLAEPRDRELAARYQNVLELQARHGIARRNSDRVRIHARMDFRRDEELVRDCAAVFRSAHAALRTLAKEKVLDEELIRELPAGRLSLEWITQLKRQLDRAAVRTARNCAAALAELLALQERIAAEYRRTVADSQPAEIVAKSDS